MPKDTDTAVPFDGRWKGQCYKESSGGTTHHTGLLLEKYLEFLNEVSLLLSLKLETVQFKVVVTGYFSQHTELNNLIVAGGRLYADSKSRATATAPLELEGWYGVALSGGAAAIEVGPSWWVMKREE